MFSITRLCIVSLVSIFASLPILGEADGAVRGSTNKCILQKVCAIDSKLQCDNAISFGSADINRPGGYIIRYPGYYCLKEDVVFDPAVSALAAPNPGAVQAAITIQASNVFLDLGPHRLSQAGAGTSTQVPYVVGILIPDAAPTNTDPNFVALQSIYIKGDDPAIIDGFSMFGIRIFGHTYDIRLSNITVKNTAQLASLALRPFPDYFPHDIVVFSATGYGPSFGVGGIAIGESALLGMGPQFFVDTGLIRQNRASSIYIDNVSCLNNFFNGINIANATDVYIGNSEFNDTFSDDPGNLNGPNGPYALINAFGGIFTGSNTMSEDPCILNMVVENSTFNSTSLKGDFTTPLVFAGIPAAGIATFPTFGAVLARSRNVTFSNCNFDNTSNTFAPETTIGTSGGISGGFISGGIEDTTFVNCTFDGAQSLGTINGFHVSGHSDAGEPIKAPRNLYLLNCTANNLQQIGSQQLPAPTLVQQIFTTGFAIFYVKDVTLDGCISQDINVSGPANTFSVATGFFLSSLPGQVTPDINVENAVLRNCVASRCITNNGGNAIGFTLFFLPQVAEAASKGVVFENCVSSGNETLVPTLTTTGIQQGIGSGFTVFQNPLQLTPDEFRSWPVSFINCKALHNKGLPVVFPTFIPGVPFYSAGFFLFGAIRHSLFSCQAEDNIFGFLLEGSTQCALRNCRADSNEDLVFDPGLGAGFTDVGFGSITGPTPSTSLFEFNHAYNNGPGLFQTGTVGNYNIYVSPGVTPPLLIGEWSTSTYAYINPAFYTPVHNISIIE